MKRVSRRGAIKTLGAAAAAPIFQPPSLSLQAEVPDPAMLAAIAEVVLPSETDRKAAVDRFTGWIRDYREAVDTDHGYGNTRLRKTGPPPARNYPAQIAALDSAARDGGARSFAAAPVAARRAIVETALAEAKIERLPGRPNGGHIASDLMAHYFASEDAANLCYRAKIDRDTCRGLPGSGKPPAPLASRAALAPASRAPRSSDLAPGTSPLPPRTSR